MCKSLSTSRAVRESWDASGSSGSTLAGSSRVYDRGVSMETAERYLSRPAVRRAVFGLLTAIFLAQGLYYSRVLVLVEDEAGYLALGSMALTGQISLYEDDIPNGRMPLPYYVLGASQLVSGPSVWAGRLVSLGVGVLVLWLTINVATELRGRTCGVLAGLVLAAHGDVIGIFSVASYHSLSALVLVGVLRLFLGSTSPTRNVIGAAATSLIFLTRTTIVPAVVFFAAVALARARTWKERLLVVVATVSVPSIFFLADHRHLKILSAVPIFDRLAAAFGYHSQFFFTSLIFDAVVTPSFSEQLWFIARIGRRYEAWVFAGCVLAALHGWALWRRAPVPNAVGGNLRLVSGLFVYMVALLFVIFRSNIIWVIGFLPELAPLVAVLLAAGFSQAALMIERNRVARAVAVVGFAGTLVIMIAFVRNPLLPVPAPRLFVDDPLARLNIEAVSLREMIAPRSEVFLMGVSAPLYLAGRMPYLRQVLTPFTMVVDDRDGSAVAKSGLWGADQMERWLSAGAEFAVIQWPLFRQESAHWLVFEARLDRLLAAHFCALGVVGNYEVYRRRVAPVTSERTDGGEVGVRATPPERGPTRC